MTAGPVETDANGQAAFSDIPTGNYTLKVADHVTLASIGVLVDYAVTPDVISDQLLHFITIGLGF